MTGTPHPGYRARPHAALVRLLLTPHFSGQVAVTDLLDGTAAELTRPGATGRAGPGQWVDLTSAGLGVQATVASTLSVAGTHLATQPLSEADPQTAGQRVWLAVIAGRTYTVTKTVGVAVSTDAHAQRPAHPRALAAAVGEAALGYRRARLSSDAAWSRLWTADIRVAGNQASAERDGTVKQADVTLLSYPWENPQPAAVTQADLNRYVPRTDPGGPSMTDAIHSIVTSALGTPGCAAFTFTLRSVDPFMRGPYYQFSESRTGGAFTFTTGAGGFLQQFLYGYTGMRWRADRLQRDPSLPPQLTGITPGLREVLPASGTSARFVRVTAAADASAPASADRGRVGGAEAVTGVARRGGRAG